MMYNQKLVASIKSKGKVLREFKDTVYIPFGSEYSILLKNLNTVRAIVNVYIDGENAVPGGLVLNAGQECDLERAIRNNNLTEGNRFKFIERTEGIEQHRGIKSEDGLVRVEYQFEKVFPTQPWSNSSWNRDKWDTKVYSSPHFGVPISGTYCDTNSIVRSMNVTASATSSSEFVNTVTTQGFVNDVGITVPGSKSEQTFHTASWFATETEKHNIILKLLGETPDNKPVAKPVTVKAKPKCVTCGRQNKAHAKFCTECGTALEIFA